MSDRKDLRALTQTFRFPGASAKDVANTLATAAIIGERSIFGRRTARSTSGEGVVRQVEGFEPLPVPLIRFDFEMRQQRTDDGLQVIVEFSQPDRTRPYLSGELVWLLLDDDGGSAAVLREEINTPTALGIVDRPLHGSRFSLRRYLFFAAGHRRIMTDVAANLRSLLDST